MAGPRTSPWRSGARFCTQGRHPGADEALQAADPDPPFLEEIRLPDQAAWSLLGFPIPSQQGSVGLRLPCGERSQGSIL